MVFGVNMLSAKLAGMHLFTFYIQLSVLIISFSENVLNVFSEFYRKFPGSGARVYLVRRVSQSLTFF